MVSETEWLLEQRRWRTEPNGPLRWATALRLKNELGKELEWRDRRFLVDILCDMYPRQVIVKCTQVGLSTIEILKALFAAQVMGWRIIYTLPTDRLVQEFHTTKIDPMMLQNPSIKPTGTDNQSTKVYDASGYALFRGTSGNNQDISLTADIIIADEADRSDLSVIEGLESRLSASEIKGQWWFTNPTRPNIGTDLKWQASDQRRWHVKCRGCGDEQPLDYWVNVDKEREAYVCRTCRGALTDDDRRNGRWIATKPGARWHGYHINHLMAPWISAVEVIDAEKNKTKEYFYNYVLGLPVIGDGLSVDASLITGAVLYQDDERRTKPAKQKFLGVDVGAGLHCVIGNEIGITKAAYLTDDPGKVDSRWEKLNQLMLQERITLCVIDNAPSGKEQVAFQRKHPRRVLRAIYDYNDKRQESWEKDPTEGTIHAHRTRMIDETIKAFAEGDLPILMDEKDKFLNGTGKHGVIENCLAHHWSALYVVGADGQDVNVVKKDRFGNVIRTWENAGPDHFAHATIYYQLAKEAGRHLDGDGSATLPGGHPSRGGRPADDDDDDDDSRGPTWYG